MLLELGEDRRRLLLLRVPDTRVSACSARSLWRQREHGTHLGPCADEHGLRDLVEEGDIEGLGKVEDGLRGVWSGSAKAL